MANIKVEVTSDSYEKFKREVLESDMIVRSDIRMSDLEIKDLTSVKLRGTPLTLSASAVKSLGIALGLNKKTIDIFKRGFGEHNVKLLSILIDAIKGQSTLGLTIVYNKKIKMVSSVYPTGTKLMSDATYFKSLESVIEKYTGSYLRSITQTIEGDIKAVLANPMMEFQFGGINDETFTAGMTFDLSAHLLYTSFFTERLVCTNGMTVTDKLCSRSVNTSKAIPEFLTAITEGEYHLNSIEEFKERIKKCYYSPASLAEVLRTGDKVDRILGELAPTLTHKMSIHKIKVHCGESVLENRKSEHCYLHTDITLWELVNEVTALSSYIEQRRIDVRPATNLGLQKLGGELMFSVPDLSPVNIKQVYPPLILH